MPGSYQLPSLPFAYEALEPNISKQIMELHHSKHHQTYVTNLNAALKAHLTGLQAGNVQDCQAQMPAISFNGGGHINHSLFWENLCPTGSSETQPSEAAPTLFKRICETWDSLENFKQVFKAALLGIQGSGWGWLVRDPKTKGQLRIITLANQESVVAGDIPILGVDMWEHAYYLQYLNGKAAYVDNIWNVINWKTAEERFKGSREDAFKSLKEEMGSPAE